MKIALSITGFYGNKENPNAGDAGYAYLKEHIIDKYDTDVIIHSWNPELEGKLVEQYKPVTYSVQKNYDFKQMLAQEGVTQEYFDVGFNREASPFKQCKLEYTASFLYGRWHTLKHIEDRKTIGGIDYDYVIATRFDIGQRGGDSVKHLKFDPELDPQYIYSAQWNQHNAGYADMWFWSNPENMSKLGEAYPEMEKHFKPNSQYEKAVTQGWPDSCMMDNNNNRDSGQFTNERFLPEDQKAKQLMKYPLWQCVNNHLYHKWFFMESGLYEKSKFL